MPPAALTDLLSRCARAARGDAAPEAELLRRVARRRDSDALAELVRRHAGLVWGVCRRMLRHEADCEDAFQATFLALVRQAPRLDHRRPLAGWLHTVASRVARKAQVRALRRASAAVPADPPAQADVAADVGGRELMATVDEELARLPARLREPVILCCIEGRTRDEAAEALGCSVAAVKSRLERGRRLLRRGLERRGVFVPTALLALGLGTGTVSAALRDRAITSAIGVVPPPVSELAVAVSGPIKLGRWAAAVLAVGVVGLGVAGMAPRADPPAKDPPKAEAAKVETPATRIDRLGDPLPEAALLRLGTTRFRHPGGANMLLLSPDEKTVLTLGWEGLYAWDTITGRERWHSGREELRHDIAVGQTPLALSPDGKAAHFILNGPGFLAIDTATGKSELRRVTSGGRRVVDQFQSIAASPVGKKLALGGPNGVAVCDLEGKVSVRFANNPTRPARDDARDRLLPWMAFSFAKFTSDGKTLAVVGSDSADTIRICTSEGAEVRSIALTKRYLDSAFSPDGSLLAVAERDDAVRVYETATGKRKHEWPVKITRETANENYVFTVAFSPNGKTVVAAASDKLLWVWDASTGKEVGRMKGHGWYPLALAFTKDGKTLYSTGWDGEVRRWDMGTLKQLPLPEGIRGSSVVAAAPDGKTLVYADGDNNLRVVDATTGGEVRTITVPGQAPDQLRFSPDSRALAVGGSSGDKASVCVVDPGTGKVSRRWDWPKGRDPHVTPVALAFSADGARLAAMMYRQNTARVWDLTREGEPLVLKHTEGYGVSFHPDGKTLVTGGWDRKLRLWGAADGKLRKELTVTLPNSIAPDPSGVSNDTRLMAVTYSPDGSRIAGFDLGYRLWLWDADTLKVRAVTNTEDIPRENTLAFSPDGLWVALGGCPGRVRVWDAWSGQLVWDRGRHRSDVHTVSFGHDSRTLMSGGADGLGYLWDLRPKEVPFEKSAALWRSLIGVDGPSAYKAFWGMLDQPDAAVATVAEQGSAFVAKVDPAQVRKWIADLDSAKFATREAAEKELAAHLRAAVPLMKEELAKASSTEQRARLQKLVDEWEAYRPRWMRAVSLLSHVGTPAAKDVLRRWAEADPDGELGRAAARAVNER
jgi:RNA polymerase sigma factor (sigma-70 family)